jgi:hypothetical protein
MLIQKWITQAIWAKTIKDGQKPIDQKVVNERLQQVLKQAKGNPSNPSTMTMSLERTMNSKNNIVYLR